MPSIQRRVGLAALLSLSLGASGCTIVKPMAGAVTGPVYAIGAIDGIGHFGCDDGRALVGFFVASSAIGAVAGLVTGMISDYQALCGFAEDPLRNWWNPFATNTMSG